MQTRSGQVCEVSSAQVEGVEGKVESVQEDITGYCGR
eukprot:COSAG06_NODE_52489_length_305_cov_0.834951_1_plen_36_part_10